MQPFIASPPRRRRRRSTYSDDDNKSDGPPPSPRHHRSPARRTRRRRRKVTPPPSPSIASNASSASVDTEMSGDSVRVPMVRLMNDPLVAEGMMLRLGLENPANAGMAPLPRPMPALKGAGAPMAVTMEPETVHITRTLGANPTVTFADTARPVDYRPGTAGALTSSMPVQASELTRAARTQLSRLGFDNTATGGPVGVDDIMLERTLMGPPPDISLELSDRLQVCGAAWRVCWWVVVSTGVRSLTCHASVLTGQRSAHPICGVPSAEPEGDWTRPAVCASTNSVLHV